MDSYPAIRNFINGGGAVTELSTMVKEWWIWCKMHRVTPLYQWVRREENTLADELSKVAATSHPLKPTVEHRIRQWLEKCGEPGLSQHTWTKTKVHVPVFDNIGLRLSEMVKSRQPGCIVVPAWHSSTWHAAISAHAKHTLALGRMGDVLCRDDMQGHAAWHMEAHLIIPLDKVAKSQKRGMQTH
jgi:hypothetical protein